MSKKSKQSVLNALLNLLETEVYSKITISAICDEATIVRKTFYNNFKNKKEVIEYLCETMVDDLFEQLQKNNQYDVSHMFFYFFQYSKENYDRILLLEENDLFYIFEKSVSTYVKNVSDAIPNNRLELTSIRFKNYAETVYTSSMIVLLQTWYKNNFQESALEMSNNLSRILKDFQTEII